MNTQNLASLLLGVEADSLMTEVLVMLASDKDEAAILRISTADYGAVAKVVVAGGTRNPLTTAFWLGKVRKYYSERICGANPGFILGVALGLFRLRVWWDENHAGLDCPDFEKIFPEFILQIIFDQGEAKNIGCDLINEAYESQMSQAIKAWVIYGGQRHGGKGIRLAQAVNILSAAYEKIRGEEIEAEVEKKEKMKISMLGLLILDQICWALFRQISVQGRVRALVLLNKSLVLSSIQCA